VRRLQGTLGLADMLAHTTKKTQTPRPLSIVVVCHKCQPSSHRRRGLLERGERVPGSRPCSSKAAVYEDSSCLARKVAVALRHVHAHVHVHVCMHMCDVLAGAAWSNFGLAV
jgi:hypothetical protein